MTAMASLRPAVDAFFDKVTVNADDKALRENRLKLRAIKFDWGRNAGERFTIQCEMFSQRLENAGITHFAEEYIGTHVSDIYTPEGRLPQQMLPFFDLYLDFDRK